MQTHLAPEFQGTAHGAAAEAILRKCVHCGFCTATCPTYQLLGDELDSPRGRIYLMKQVFEGTAPSRATQLHLDRCLTCRSCETTCPSGVQYGHLVDIGRQVLEAKVARPWSERVVRWLLKEGLTSPLFAPAMALGRLMRPLLPAALKDKVPTAPGPRARLWPQQRHSRRVLMLEGCVQPAMLPNINSATARVLDAAGIEVQRTPGAGCCGALRTHLGDVDGGLADMRRLIDAWWPAIEGGEIEAIVMNASGCGVQVKDYGHALAGDPDYAEKARRVSALTRDLSELLPDLVPRLQPLLGAPVSGAPARVAFHPPCTLQHGQQLRGGVESGLRALGFEVTLPVDSHLCCGSAGTYSVLQPELSHTLRERKLGHLQATGAPVIASANVGCIQHLQAGTGARVAHWVELLDEALTERRVKTTA
jgi:glycolate oxidase iron-sulfur subunit